MVILVLGGSTAAAIALLSLYYWRRAQIARFARAIVSPSLDPRQVAFALGEAIFTGIGRRGKDPLFLTRILAPLGPSPVAVLRHGGCCSGIHRLFITALDTLGIPASQITVLRRVAPALAHCLVQVKIGDTPYLIDADYGVWLHDGCGRPLSLLDLQRGAVPVIEPFVAGGVARYVGSARTRPPGFPDRDYYRFDYELTRTANWAEGPVKRIAYFVLKPLTRGRIDRLLLPASLEWPELLLACALCTVAATMLVVAQTLAG